MPIYKNELTPYERQRDKMLRYEYATYVMLSSYFKKSKIANKIIEDRYKLNYAELSKTKQEDLEEIVIQMVDDVLIPKLSKIKNMEDKEITLIPERIAGSELHKLTFEGEGFKFSIILKSVYDQKKKKEVLYGNFVDKQID